MKGSINLTNTQIDVNVMNQPGTYILANKYNIAVYVGRADLDLNLRIKDHLPENENNLCIKRSDVVNFYFVHTTSSKDAYILECKWYHNFRPNCNIAHPAKNHFSWSCPICGL